MSETPAWFGGGAMSDQADRPDPAEPVTDEVADLSEAAPEPVEPETTGDEAVDVVVSSLRGLDDLPVAEHVAVFERAHESLRQVLSGAGEPVEASRG